jgi:uncharacterized protein Yka (UPF0111/DUF47 family)
MSDKVASSLEDMESLLSQIKNFEENSQMEWNQVLNKWADLRSVWRDQQFDKFEPLFENLAATYKNVEVSCDTFNQFMNEQVRILEDKQSRLGNLPG